MKLNVRLFLTGLTLGIVATVLAFRITYPSSRLSRVFPRGIPQQAKAVEGTLTISGSSQTLTGDITAARIVDSANSSYFIDPASSGTSLSLAGAASISGSLTLPNGSDLRSAFGPTMLSYKSGANAWSTGLIIQDATGNVGIGTTTPAQKLDVVGTVNATAFSGDGSALTGIAGTPTGAVVFFNLASCPSGWTALAAAAGRVVVARAANESIGSTVGTALGSLEDRTHTHTGPSHTHSSKFGAWDANITGSGGTGFASTCATSADDATMVSCSGQSWDGGGYVVNTGVSASGTGATGTAATSNVIPYVQLLACQKS